MSKRAHPEPAAAAVDGAQLTVTPPDGDTSAVALVGALITPMLAIIAASPATLGSLDPAIATHLHAAGVAQHEAEQARAEALASVTARADAAEAALADARQDLARAKLQLDELEDERDSLCVRCDALENELAAVDDLVADVRTLSNARSALRDAVATVERALADENAVMDRIMTIASRRDTERFGIDPHGDGYDYAERRAAPDDDGDEVAF